MHDELMRLWVESEVARLTGEQSRQRAAAGQPGPEGAGMKLTFARLAQAISGLDLQLHAESGLRYDDWTLCRPELVDLIGREPGYRYLRARGNSIEGGTSEILRNTIAERILRPATRTPRRQRHCLEGPEPMNADLLYSETEEALRDSVRRLLADRCPPEAIAAVYDTGTQNFSGVWKELAADLGLAGLLVPEQLGGAGAGAREVAVVMEEIGRAVAPVPFLSSAVLATVALLRAGETDCWRRWPRAPSRRLW